MRTIKRKLPKREHVFTTSLMFHGFRFSRSLRNLKKSKGYLIPATDREDHDGIDFWVKMPDDGRIFPLQITQRGVGIYKKHKKPSSSELQTFTRQSEARIRRKRAWCKRYRIGFVLVRDFDGSVTNRQIAWGDIKALRYTLERLAVLPFHKLTPLA